MLQLFLLPVLSVAFQQQSASRAGVAVKSTKEELVEFANSNPTPASGFWDPLKLSDASMWGMGNEATIAFLRHSEIKCVFST